MTTATRVHGDLEFTPLGPDFGAEVTGVDVSETDREQIAALRAALTEHKLLILRNQRLDDAAHIEFGRRLGELTAGHPVHDSGAVPPEVYALDSQDNGFADVWHLPPTRPTPP
ncbi:TauD/TfdA dioxygenase family protein [Nocardia sp. 2TAF39]|uniref:TauD/TfdA dioxygenase family protein n=1 Tax=unclassified Nocardia TaxID=2637762 RepID=UPI003F96696A